MTKKGEEKELVEAVDGAGRTSGVPGGEDLGLRVRVEVEPGDRAAGDRA